MILLRFFIGPRGSQSDADKAAGKAEDAAGYRDRAKERREGANPDYLDSAVEHVGTLSAVAPPGSTGVS